MCTQQIEEVQVMTIKGVLELGDWSQIARVLSKVAKEFNINCQMEVSC